MNNRIQFINHKGKQVLVVDCSNCSARQTEELAREVPEIVTMQARGSVLLLEDFRDTSFDQETIRTMKESAVFNKPYIKRSAWIGAENLSPEFKRELENFSGRLMTSLLFSGGSTMVADGSCGLNHMLGNSAYPRRTPLRTHTAPHDL